MINYKSNELLHSEDFVEWDIHTERRENLQTTEKISLATYSCSRKDYESFYPINSAQTVSYNFLRNQSVLRCIDKDANLEIFGMDDINSYALNVDLIPCKACNKTKEEMQEYL